jgi:D-3-phosphoglycerate dehydrogenase
MQKVLITDSLTEQGLEILKDIAEVHYAPGMDKAEIIKTISQYNALLVRSGTKVDKEIIQACSSEMKIIGRAGVGVDNIDLDAATKKGILVVNSPDGNTTAAAEHTVSMMMSLARMIPPANSSMKEGKWLRSKFVGVELNGKTLGIVGLGKIGTKVAIAANALGMKLIAYDPVISESRANSLNVKLVDLEKIWELSDFITLHIPKTPETVNLINKDTIAKMKPDVRIINCARGGVINEQDLADAIKEGKIAGAALDVFDQEPINADNPLISLGNNVILTPHLGASTEEAQINVAIDVAEQIKEVLCGGFARSAVNLPSFRGISLADFLPTLELSDKLGIFMGQFCGNARPIELNIEFRGNLNKKETEPLVLAVTRGFLSGKVENISFVNAKLVAQEKGLKVVVSKSPDASDYAEEMIVSLHTDKGILKVAGTLHGDKLPMITRINDYNFFTPPAEMMLLTLHEDKPGVIAKISKILGDKDINISGMALGRQGKREEALMICSIDEELQAESLAEIKSLDGIIKATFIKLPITTSE